MTDTSARRALGRGLGALIPTAPPADRPAPGGPAGDRPVDVFFGGGPMAVRVEGTRGPEAQPDGATVVNHDGHVKGDRDQGGPQAGEHDPGAAGPAWPETQQDEHRLRPVPGARFAELPVELIVPNPRQPRTHFDEDELAELVHSIREIGVLQPVVVRPVGNGDQSERTGGNEHGEHARQDVSEHGEQAHRDVSEGTGEASARYELVMGERRWRAAREAGLTVIPAIVRSTGDDAMLRDALLENLHRSQLNPLEEAAAYRQLLDDFGCTQDELAGRIGRSRPQVTNTLRLLKLPPLVQRRVAAGVLSAGHARALLGLADGAAMERVAQRIVAEGLSVRSVEELVAVGVSEHPSRRPRPGTRRPQLEDLAARLADRFDTRVSIALGRQRGRLSVEFASVDDLHRILSVMGVDESTESSLRDAREDEEARSTA